MLLNDKKILASSEKTCEECGKAFTVINADMWAYKHPNKGGHTLYFCRYNCCRAGEKKRDEQIKINRSNGRKIELKANKPKKGVLEKDLMLGLSIAQISKKYEASVQTIHNWIKSYGLTLGSQVQKKAVVEKSSSAGDDFDIVADQAKRAKELFEKPIVEEMVQEHPEVEIQKMPEQEISEEDQERARQIFASFGIDISKPDQAKMIKEVEDISAYEEYVRLAKDFCLEVEPEDCKANVDENMDIPAAEAKCEFSGPEQMIEALLSGVQSDIELIRQMYIKRAEEEFKARIAGVFEAC